MGSFDPKINALLWLCNIKKTIILKIKEGTRCRGIKRYTVYLSLVVPRLICERAFLCVRDAIKGGNFGRGGNPYCLITLQTTLT